MSYLQFHLVFILPPILLLWLRNRGKASLSPLALTAAIALIYTTPWDNYLVWRGVWQYGPERVLGTIGYVPIEEYLFFALQPFLTGLWLFEQLRRSEPLPAPVSPAFRWSPVVVWLALAAAGVALLFTERGTYAGLILAWAAPVVAAQWALGADAIRARLRPYLVGIAVPTVYLWIADAIAIRLGIWDISNQYSFGIDPLGLPVEEALFFLITNVLVVQGALLFRYPPAILVRRRPALA